MLTITPSYDQLIVGATCAGLGNLLAQPGESLLVEASSSLGLAFIEAFRPGSGWDADDGLDDLARDVRRELIERNVLKDGRVHLPAVGAVLFDRLHKSGADYLFLTDVCEVKATGDGYEIRLSNRSGESTVSVKRILDTTTCLLSKPEIDIPLKSKRVNANLKPSGEDVPALPASGDGFTLTAGRWDSEVFLSLELPLDADWPQARQALHRFWMARPDTLKGWDLASVATQLVEIPEKAISPSENWRHLPSAIFENPLAALAAGARVLEPQGA
jgi:hypothetical protein